MVYHTLRIKAIVDITLLSGCYVCTILSGVLHSHSQGGFEAVVWSDVLQFLIIVSGITFILIRVSIHVVYFLGMYCLTD